MNCPKCGGERRALENIATDERIWFCDRCSLSRPIMDWEDVGPAIERHREEITSLLADELYGSPKIHGKAALAERWNALMDKVRLDVRKKRQ